MINQLFSEGVDLLTVFNCRVVCIPFLYNSMSHILFSEAC